MNDALRVHIENEADLFILEYRVKNFAKKHSLEESSLLLICRELATNILKYGVKGFVEIKVQPEEIVIEAHDVGKDGGNPGVLSPSRGLGIGLKVVKNNADELKVERSFLGGLAFVVKLSLREKKKRLVLETGIATRPHHLEERNGDLCLVRQLFDWYMVVVADALGHGKKAYDVANLVKEHSLRFNSLDLRKYYWELDRKLSGSRGSALFVALISKHEIEYVNLGNIRAWIVSGEESRRLLESPGVVGRFPIDVKINRENRSLYNAMLIVCTDGISSQFVPGALNTLGNVDIQAMAEAILAKYGIPGDDATVAIVKG